MSYYKKANIPKKIKTAIIYFVFKMRNSLPKIALASE